MLEVTLTVARLKCAKKKRKITFIFFPQDCQQGKAKLASGSVSLAPSGINEKVSQRL